MAARRNEDNDLPKVKPNKENLRKASRIFRYLKPYRGKYILGLVFLGLTAATAIAFPMLLSRLINASGVSPVGGNTMDAVQNAKISTDELLNNINIFGIYMLLLFIAQAVFSFLG
ncbi:MAG: hypothetical protein M0D57_20845 [Sphingobacteriales bacterium JAD_PAG50586_3]|nr:MAG: hypothetical protein M0D57_20845 [Sphingobacteriales bacterium JAD_PAG50586_3]